MMDIIRLSIVLILFHIVFLFSTQNYFFMFTLGMNIICKESERTALLSFKQYLKDPSDSLSSWSGENCCRWVGVHCHNKTDHVIHLHLHDLGLSGELNPSLQELKQLRHLDLSLNDFDGISIPGFLGSLQSLRYLNLSRAGFIGMIPHQLGNLSNLRYLDLLNLELTVVGNFQWISHLSSLKHLDLSGTNITNASSNWFHVINMLPSLLVLRLSHCGLSGAATLPTSLSYVNFSSLAILDLSHNKLNSTLPEWLYSLTNLQQLDLSYNKNPRDFLPSGLNGRIPPCIGNLTKLTLLDLSFNQLEGEIPITIGNLCKLQKLDLSHNQLKGEISGFLGSSIGCIADSLEYFGLSYNRLSGPIPLSIGRLINLKSLSLGGNSFSGSIPLSIGRLSLLEELELRSNKLNGSLPESLGNLSKLVGLYIIGNAFDGVVVSELHFANLTNLQHLSMDSLVLKISHAGWVPPFQLFYAYLKNCRLGPEFPIWLKTQKNLTSLNLSRNKISGTIPTWFWNFTTTNQFGFDLSHNELHGELPKVINTTATAINLKSNQFAGQLPRVTLNVRKLDLSNNSFSGPISTFLCNSISGINYLEFLDLSNNRLSGDLSDCWVYWTSLQWLSLGRNEITGKIPRSMGSLLQLRLLHLSKNNLSGELPSSLRNCTLLTGIDLGENRLTGRLPIWLGQSFQRLQYLRLRSNKFSDEIPLEFCHLASLQVLDIAHNDLRGSIPRCFNNFSAIATKETLGRMLKVVYYIDDSSDQTTSLVMKGMELKYGYDNIRYVTSLDLSTNSFSGEIPEEITSLIGLLSLNLSKNHFTGKIPEKIGNMVSLESLDLSNNNISGTIPQSISGLSFLSNLNLSYNNLLGKIPLGTQLQSFNESSYIGNRELCGPPLKICNKDEPSNEPGDIDDRADEDWLEMKWFYMSMGVGFAVGFWAFWGVMVLKSSWRIAYFRFLDDTKDKLSLLF